MNADDGAVGRQITEHFFELRGRDLASENEASGRSPVGEPRDERARGLGRCRDVGQHAIDRDIHPVHLEKARSTEESQRSARVRNGRLHLAIEIAFESSARRALRFGSDESAGTYTEQSGKHFAARWKDPSLVVRVALFGAPPRISIS